MKEPTIWEIPLPEVTLDDLFQAEGADYLKSPPRPGMVGLRHQILEEAAALICPIAIWREVGISGTGGQELFLEGGQKLTSRLLVKVAGTADKLMFFAVTIGKDLEDRVDYYKKTGKIFQAFVLDAAGSAFVAKSSMSAVGKIEEVCRHSGREITFPLGPGHSYWTSLEDMQTIVHFLQADKIGLHLTDSNIIIPRKSIAMVTGVGQNLPDMKGKTHCDFCDRQKNCNMNKFGSKRC
ncbi:Vitamin B12 dependent methionine synthase activation subunit [Thermincola potens]|uniref:Vitamin B12 dependent methionine synthase activation region n=1 Tax=Thermincola potens (strain JR) TaxID=635013 RepID=D5XBM1_THEPJ|nr:Vitamin B12 dependent methionine synthase activation subunit [Thermincola potens]ADG83450.1 Vitamin B12 dependent methionine synthase activation region [Thermincola potens JR]